MSAATAIGQQTTRRMQKSNSLSIATSPVKTIRRQMAKVPRDDEEMQRLIAVDWSGRVDAAGQRRHIWAAIWTVSEKGGSITLEAGRTREELTDWLVTLIRETPRMVVSLDCCFSFPAWFLAEHNCATVFDFWRHVAAGHGERWLARECEEIARDER